MSYPVAARFETRRDGYERWRSWEDGRDRYVYVHRLAAVAWEILDGLDDPRHVHHADGIKWLNVEENLATGTWRGSASDLVHPTTPVSRT